MSRTINGIIPREWDAYVTQQNLGLEVIPAVLYSTKNYTSGTDTVLTFFDTVQGSRPDLTNMTTASQLPNPESFLIENIRVFFGQPVRSDDSGEGDATTLVSSFNDLVQLSSKGILQLRISNKLYGPWPITILPMNSFVKGAFSTGSDLLANFGQLDGNLYPLVPNLMLAPLQEFAVTLGWPGGAITLSTGSETTLPIKVIFDGKKARSIQ